MGLMGNTRPDRLGMWSMTANRVRGVTQARIRPSTSSGPATGRGMSATTTRAPFRWAM